MTTSLPNVLGVVSDLFSYKENKLTVSSVYETAYDYFESQVVREAQTIGEIELIYKRSNEMNLLIYGPSQTIPDNRSSFKKRGS